MYEGSKELLDYSSTKGAITAFTRSLSANLIGDGIRVNAVAPGPIWTPLNPMGGATPDKLKHFGEGTPMGRPGQPNRSEEHTSELQSLMRISYAVFCLKKKNNNTS